MTSSGVGIHSGEANRISRFRSDSPKHTSGYPVVQAQHPTVWFCPAPNARCRLQVYLHSGAYRRLVCGLPGKVIWVGNAPPRSGLDCGTLVAN